MPGEAGRLLEAAAALGDRLARDAVWHEGRCTWLGDAVELDQGEWRVVHRSLDGDVYGGTSGVAVFLARLWSATQVTAHRDAATGAVRHALAWWQSAPTADWSLYGGATGVAWAAAEVGERVNEAFLRSQAVELARRIAAEVPSAPLGDDLLGGRAGVIVGMLGLARRLDLSELVEPAARLGAELVRRGNDDGTGLSWPATADGEQPGLCGLGHGASGVAHALLELHAVTGEADLREAAEAAARYERSWLSREHQNWPDLRELTREQLRAGAQPAYSEFWCHGGAGIGLARLRGYQNTGASVLLADAGAALQGASMWLQGIGQGDGFAANPSVCHGLGSLAELLLSSAEALEQPALRAQALPILDRMVAAVDRRSRWPSGVLGGDETPGLMLGLAGTGAVLLRAALPELTIPVGLLCADRPLKSIHG